MQGIETVPRNRQRLFGQFDRRINENIKAIKLWISEVERAQEVRREEIKELLHNQSKITRYYAAKNPVHARTMNTDMNMLYSHRDTRDAWAQQDLRQLLLQTKPNVRFRKS